MSKGFVMGILTPDRMVVEAEVDRVVLPALDGILEVTPGRWPLVTALRADLVIWYVGGKASHAAVQGGIAVFADGRLHVLTSNSVVDASHQELLELRSHRQVELRAMLDPPTSRDADSVEP